jgi:hypothetical protein
MIGETSPRFHYVDRESADSLWSGFYGPLFDLIAEWPVIKAVSYINWNWEEVDPVRWSGWGNADLTDNPELLTRYSDAIVDPRFVHTDAELYSLIGWSP